jgi:hypothetical protein
MTRSEILTNIDNPGQLERMYRNNKSAFKAEFNLLYPELSDNKLATFWKERLSYESSDISWGSTKELIFVIFIAAIAGVLAKLPDIFNLNPEFFYPRNIGLIVFPILTTYFIWKQSLSIKKSFFAGAAFLIAAIFINQLPANDKSDTLILSCIHLPIFLWAVLGLTYLGDNPNSLNKRLDFLRYNGDLVIMSGLILIAGGMLTGITIGLFSVIGLDIREFYFKNIVIFGLPAVPVVATYLTQTNPQLVDKISPVIAKIFSPLVLITLVVYLLAIFYSGKDPYQDREFLIIFNLLLIGVMAIILFSLAETSKKSENRVDGIILFALSIVTVIVNGIALSAILFRISEWGITPNRLAVLGANILMLTNLLIITFRLFRSVSKKAEIREVENSISVFLPVYILWAMIVAFVFPFVFQFK